MNNERVNEYSEKMLRACGTKVVSCEYVIAAIDVSVRVLRSVRPDKTTVEILEDIIGVIQSIIEVEKIQEH